ncbi:hypothetical protein BJX65DRAFT_290309 [Aspergillus insuetus]
MFFSKLIPMFSVMHRPTFVFQECPAPMLLNAIALGSFLSGGPNAISQGIATSWSEIPSHKGEYDKCSGVQLVFTGLLRQV